MPEHEGFIIGYENPMRAYLGGDQTLSTIVDIATGRDIPLLNYPDGNNLAIVGASFGIGVASTREGKFWRSIRDTSILFQRGIPTLLFSQPGEVEKKFVRWFLEGNTANAYFPSLKHSQVFENTQNFLDRLTDKAEPDNNFPDPFAYKDLTIDPRHNTVSRSGQVIALTPTESRFFNSLAIKPGKILTFDQIKLRVWGSIYITHDSVRIYVSRMRGKLGDSKDEKGQYHYIKTAPRIGFFIDDPSVDKPQAIQLQ